MGIQTEWLTVLTETNNEPEDMVFLNEFQDRRYVFKKPNEKYPHVRQTAFQGLNRRGEWIELMEVTEERYPGQKPFFTIGIFVPAGQEQRCTKLKKYTYGDILSGWEEGFATHLSGDMQETVQDLQEMNAVFLDEKALPRYIDTEATAHAFLEQIEQNAFVTPPLFQLEYQPGQ